MSSIPHGTLSYRILLRQEPDGGYTVTVPTLPGCIPYGDDINETIVMAREAIELYLESLAAHGEEIPTDHRHGVVDPQTGWGRPQRDHRRVKAGHRLAPGSFPQP